MRRDEVYVVSDKLDVAPEDQIRIEADLARSAEESGFSVWDFAERGLELLPPNRWLYVRRKSARLGMR